MLLGHGGSTYHLRSRIVQGIGVDRLRHLRSIKKPRVSRSKSPKPKEKEKKVVESDNYTEDSDDENGILTSVVPAGPPPPLLAPPGTRKRQTCKWAEIALSFWDQTKEPKYIFVRPVRSSALQFPKGVFLHSNFEAKRVDDPQAPAELFFAQVLVPWDKDIPVSTNICESLGITSSFSDEPEKCTDCEVCYYVRHPKNREFMGMITD